MEQFLSIFLVSNSSGFWLFDRQREIKTEYFVVLEGMYDVKNNLQLSKAY